MPGLITPEAHKRELRLGYVRVGRARCYDEAIERSARFWQRYEQVNRDFLPDDPVYSLTNRGFTLSVTADALTVVSSAGGQARVLEVLIGGEATASAVNRVLLQRGGATTTTTPTAFSAASTGNITLEKFNSRSPAAAGSYGSATTAALSTAVAMPFAFNAFGGFIDWKAAPGEEIYIFGDGTNKEWIGLRSASGTSIVSTSAIVEEL